jgi:exopolyphosphatase/guanosine-5'-triphosphate,3'-diphosphate pyrophosphatase
MTVPEEHVVAFVDLGTNSVRLLVARIKPNHSYTVLTDQKEVVRLGEREFVEGSLDPAAMERALLVCRRFVEVAHNFGAQDILAVATSALREARNQSAFVRRLRREADLDVHVISGVEEARLIYIGVSNSMNLGDKLALFVDIGGGSTEIAVGDQHRHRYLESLQLGAIRLTSLFLPDERGPISAQQYAQLQWYVRNTAVYAVQQVRSHKVQVAVGSSGTIENLAQVAARAFKSDAAREDVLRFDRLQKTVSLLCSLSLEERRAVPGINPERADIIIAGAAILDTLMQELDLPEIQVSRRGLRDGLLFDYLARSEHASWVRQMSVRKRSVLQLGRACGFDEDHSQRVANLALEIFDSGREARLHRLAVEERELLEYAGLLHDIGSFLSYYNQHMHTYYLIRNADLIGFDQRETAIMATVALYHRGSMPRKKHPEFAGLDKGSQHIVRVLSVCLRLAESLDRGHAGVVRHARLRKAGPKAILEISCLRDCELQLWGVRTHERAVKEVFGRTLATEVTVEAAPLRNGSPGGVANSPND